MEIYLERPKTMQAVLNESYQLYRFGPNLVSLWSAETCKNSFKIQHRHVEALHLVLRALKLHGSSTNLQIAGSASMFYIIRKPTIYD